MAPISYPSEKPISEVTLCSSDEDPEVLHRITVLNTNRTGEKELMFTRQPLELEDEMVLYEPEVKREGHNRMKTADKTLAVQKYLQHLEKYWVDEQQALDELQCRVPFFETEFETITQQSKEDRVRQLVETAKYGIQLGYGFQLRFLKEGAHRKTNPSDDVCKIVRDALDTLPNQSIACYQNAFETTKFLKQSNTIDSSCVEYCEGFGLSKYGGLSTGHAWVEVDSQVVEVTWPWTKFKPHKKTIYYGFQVEWDSVTEKVNQRPTYASVYMPDELYWRSSAVQNAIGGVGPITET